MSSPAHTPRLSVRVPEAGLAWLDELGKLSGSNRTDVLRACLTVAAEHRDEVLGWLITTEEIPT